MSANYTKGLYKDYEQLLSKNEKLESEYRLLRQKHELLEREIKWQAALAEKQQLLETEIASKNSEIEALKKEVARLHGVLNLDGTNSGIPTSQTPIHKNKNIPNSRIKSGKSVGGQTGHPKQKLEAFAENEITETQSHELQTCPKCGSQAIIPTDKSICKDELDYEVVVIRRRHEYPIYHCTICGKDVHAPIANNLKEENQYGSQVQALALALTNMGNVSVSKTRRMIYGLSEEEINPSEGYIAKLEKRAAKELTSFYAELKKECLQQSLLYWDDTVIAINKNRACLRFYGTEKIALYTAHLQKNKVGLDEDGLLQLLPPETVVMHDHNKVNYNKDYSYSNIECNAHLLRDLQKTTDNLQHSWSQELEKLLKKTNEERKEAIAKGSKAFGDEYIKSFFAQFDRIMLKAIEENEADANKYYNHDEKVLILRILKYKDHYLAWVVNFEMPFTNNESERALRGIKSKMKISGQFKNEATAQNYAIVKSYIESCYRNGIDEVRALSRLCEGNPYTVAEIMQFKSDI